MIVQDVVAIEISSYYHREQAISRQAKRLATAATERSECEVIFLHAHHKPQETANDWLRDRTVGISPFRQVL